MMQTIVLKVSLTVDPVKLVAWAKEQMGICCNYPAHESQLLDSMEPALQAQGILAHTFMCMVPEEIAGRGSVETLETGIPSEIVARIEREYQTAFALLCLACDGCGEPATKGYIENPYVAEVYGQSEKKWYCSPCYNKDLEDI